MSSSSSSSSSSKCVICFSTFQSGSSKNPEHFTTVFQTFCRLLQIDLMESMRWNFQHDNVPFCEFCSSAVEKLKGLYDQLEFLQEQISNILNATKLSIINSEHHTTPNTSTSSIDLAVLERVNYFRHLVIRGSSRPRENPIHPQYPMPSTSLHVEPPSVKLGNQMVADNGINLSFLDRMNEACGFPDGINKSYPLIDMKGESHTSKTDIVVKHEMKKNIMCQLCDEGSNQSPFHFNRFHSPNCHKRLQSSSSSSSTSGEKPTKCDYCDKTFAHSSNLISHRRIHTGEKPYKCDYCDKTFTHSSNLITHRRIHTGEKPHKCKFCDKRFVTSSNLISHGRIHTGEKLFKCDFCDKSFVTSSNLINHRRLHTGYRREAE